MFFKILDFVAYPICFNFQVQNESLFKLLHSNRRSDFPFLTFLSPFLLIIGYLLTSSITATLTKSLFQPHSSRTMILLFTTSSSLLQHSHSNKYFNLLETSVPCCEIVEHIYIGLCPLIDHEVGDSPLPAGVLVFSLGLLCVLFPWDSSCTRFCMMKILPGPTESLLFPMVSHGQIHSAQIFPLNNTLRGLNFR